MSLPVGIYLRVSDEKLDTENQLPELMALCAARGWTDPLIVREIESGAKVRPKLDKLCDDAARGRIRVLCVWALDRLGRNLWDTVARVRRLAACNVRLVSVREPWLEQEGGVRDLMLFIFAWVAEQERRRLIERTHAGLAKARAKGVRLGRPASSPAAVAHAVSLVLTHGHSIRRAAIIDGTVSEATVRRALARVKRGAQNGGAAPEGSGPSKSPAS